MAWLGAALKFANTVLGFGERADKKQQRREDMQAGAQIGQAEQLEAENAELRKDAKVLSRPGNLNRALARMRKRAADRDKDS